VPAVTTLSKTVTMKVLVIGSGGREHAICWKLKQSLHVQELYCAPGNAGIAEIATCFPADISDISGLADLAQAIGAELTVVGPEAPLVAGLADEFAARRLRIVAPSSGAARLEGSKIFAKQFMSRHCIPTARFSICDSIESAYTALNQYDFPVVVKADGLAAGKGVRIVSDRREFDDAISAMMIKRVFGEAGSRLVLEECLSGREASLMLLSDGCDWKLIAPARDYKRLCDGDQGPNTGGMGSYSAPGLIDDLTLERIKRDIIAPTLAGMADEGNPFRGVLYLGLMLTEEGPKVLEYNVRLGDPEAQAVMVRLGSDLVEILEAVIDGSISSVVVNWSGDSSVCVVAVSGGYPGEFEKGKVIRGLNEAKAVEGVVVFHAGTMRDEQGSFLTAGGRVLGVTARARTLAEARTRAYEAIGHISFDRMHYRKDIAAD
jgi:phosphoribosylamine--glycine ligase